MNDLIQYLISHGLMLLAGTSILLAGGAMAMLPQRSPIHRQRVGEMAVGCTLFWTILACVPMRRWTPVQKPAPATERVGHVGIVAPTQKLGSSSAGSSLIIPRPAASSRPQSLEIPDRALAIPPEASPVGPGRLHSWPELASELYVAGSLVCLLYLALGHLLLARLIRRCLPADRELQHQLLDVKAVYGLRRVRLLVHPGDFRPMSFGVLWPTVVLGAELAQNPRQRAQVLRHELAHVAQRDALGNALFNLALPVMWVHPLYVWIRARTFMAREMVADQRAAGFTQRHLYAADLVSLARECRSARPGPLAVVGMFHFTTGLTRRIHMLLTQSDPFPVRCSVRWRIALLGGAASAILLSAGVLGVRPVMGADRAGAEPKRQAVKEIEPAREALTEPGVLVVVESGELVTLTPQGGATDALGPAGRIALGGSAGTFADPIRLSPDAKRVAYVVRKTDVDPTVLNDPPLWRVVTRELGTGKEQVVEMRFWQATLCWSPDGKQLAMTRVPADDNGPSVLVDLAAGSTHPLILPAGASVCEWCRDGKTFLVAYQGAQDKRFRLGLVERGQESPRELTVLGEPDGAGMSWAGEINARLSSDGKKLLFLDTDPAVPPGYRCFIGYKPYVLDVAAGTRVPLAGVQKGAHFLSASWSPNGKHVAYTWLQLPADRLANPDNLTRDEIHGEANAFLSVADIDGKNPTMVVKGKATEWRDRRTLGSLDWR